MGTVVQSATPPDAIVAVVSKGDPRLIEVEGRTGVHFPHDAEGRYAGFYPKTAEDAIAHVEALSRHGTQFLCLPVTAFWWLEHYRALAAWLDAHCRVAAHDPETCVIYDLLRAPNEPAEAADAGAGADAQVRALLDALLPENASLLVTDGALEGLAAPGRTVARLGSGRALGGGGPADRPTFVLVRRDKSATPPPAAVVDLLGRHTEPLARRRHLCDVLRVKAGPDESGTEPPKAATMAPGPSSPLGGEEAERLSNRLERLGLPRPGLKRPTGYSD